MSIKTILVPFYGESIELSALESAFILAKEHAANVTCLHISPASNAYGYVEPMAPVTSYVEIKEAIEAGIKEQAERAEALFEKMVQKYDAPLTSSLKMHKGSMSASWYHATNAGIDETIAERGKLADIIILSSALPDIHDSYFNAIITALFETGRPVVIMPHEKKALHFGSKIAVAWDASQAATHAMHAAIPFMHKAEEVTLITVDEADQVADGPLVLDASLYLAAHDVAANYICMDSASLSIGETLMEEALKLNADMLVMGAYAHSRLRQLFIGGPTKFVLKNTKIPIFMMH